VSTPASAAPQPIVRANEPPRHVAIIMDGNGRWATRRSLPRGAGHRAGVQSAREIVRACGERGVQILTLFAFSSENWQRPRREVGLLMNLFMDALRNELSELASNNVRMRFIGDRSTLSEQMQRMMTDAERLTADNTGLCLIIAVSYGGRWDVVQAARALAEQAATGRICAADIDERALEQHLSLADLPDPDLFIRTGGERRISNFLLWNLAYSELYFSDLLWPDFDSAALDQALEFFAGRERRFGRLQAQAPAG
jgi:undecaprenyl diphosphate synthase